MPTYNDLLFSPPAPVASVVIRNPHNLKQISDVSMLLDTGADITLVPRSVVEQLDVPFGQKDQYEIMGFDGKRSYAPCATLEMIFLKRAFRGRYLLVDDERGILGRDVLNHLSLLLDGPRQQWLEHIHP